ncbi:MAG: DUF2165 family protein [Gammaproteobacteria bacterium]
MAIDSLLAMVSLQQYTHDSGCFCKIALLASIALYANLVVFDNVTDFGSNLPVLHHAA